MERIELRNHVDYAIRTDFPGIACITEQLDHGRGYVFHIMDEELFSSEPFQHVVERILAELRPAERAKVSFVKG